jgi:hypothetical protein
MHLPDKKFSLTLKYTAIKQCLEMTGISFATVLLAYKVANYASA